MSSKAPKNLGRQRELNEKMYAMQTQQFVDLLFILSSESLDPWGRETKGVIWGWKLISNSRGGKGMKYLSPSSYKIQSRIGFQWEMQSLLYPWSVYFGQTSSSSSLFVLSQKKRWSSRQIIQYHILPEDDSLPASLLFCPCRQWSWSSKRKEREEQKEFDHLFNTRRTTTTDLLLVMTLSSTDFDRETDKQKSHAYHFSWCCPWIFFPFVTFFLQDLHDKQADITCRTWTWNFPLLNQFYQSCICLLSFSLITQDFSCLTRSNVFVQLLFRSLIPRILRV